MDNSLKILFVLNDLKKGGVQGVVMALVRKLSSSHLHFDVMLLSDTKGYYEDEFLNYGTIYRIPLKRKKTKIKRAISLITNFYAVKRKMREFFRANSDYNVVHSHHLLLNAPVLIAAKRNNIPVRIAHSHVNKPTSKETQERFYVRVYLKVCSYILNETATQRFGVTHQAVSYMFGSEKNGIMMKNPVVDFKHFDSIKYPNMDNIDSPITILQVGSYSARKNQLFTVKVIEHLHAMYPNSRLYLMGYQRPDKEDYLSIVQEYIIKNQMSDFIEFLPQDFDVADALSRSTIMMIPSLQEGLPGVALESQAMGVPCFVSTDVSKDCDCGLCSFFPLSYGPQRWAEEIIKYVNEHGRDKHSIDMSDWDSDKVCQEYLEYWMEKHI